MASEHKMKTVDGCEESKVEGGRKRGRKANAKGPKKAPQRGLGVAQLERLRMQESWKKMSETYGGAPALNELPCHTPMFVSGNIPVMCGNGAPSSNHVHAGLIAFQCPQQQQLINAHCPITGNKGWFVSNRLSSSFGSGPPLFAGTPLETSKELSSMPNLHSQSQSQSQSFDVSLKKTRFSEDSSKGSNARRDRLEIGPNVNGHDFLGFKPQSAAPNPIGENGDFCNKLTRHAAADAYATPNLEECLEVVAVHRRGNLGSGRVFMEYEFFPGKDGRGTTSKEMEVAPIGSAAVGGEASSNTATTYGDSASNSIDLSLKLSH